MTLNQPSLLLEVPSSDNKLPASASKAISFLCYSLHHVKLCPDGASYPECKAFCLAQIGVIGHPLQKCTDLDFNSKSRLLLLLESGLNYIIVIEYIYSYILNVNYTEICKLLLIFLYKQMGLSRYGAY